MHILILPSDQYALPDRPLAGTFQKAQAEALRAAGHDVGVVAPRGRHLRDLPRGLMRLPRGTDTSVEEGTNVVRTLDWNLLPDRTPFLPVRSYVQRGLRLYRGYVAQFGPPDVVHAHGMIYAGSLAAHLRARHGCPTIVTEHSSAFLTAAIRAWHRHLARAAWASAQRRVVVSSALGRGIDRQLGVAVGDWSVIANCLDSLFEDEPPRAAVQVESTKDLPLRLLSIGALVPIKNHAALIEAFSAFAPGGNSTLTIGGDGPLAGALRRQARLLGIEDRVRFIGALSRRQVREEMLYCDALVLPSLTETFGVVLIEALACGRPVVATSCGGPVDFVEPADGVLAKSPTAADLSEALAVLVERYASFDSSDIRARCLNRFSQAAIARKLGKLYEEAVGEATGRSSPRSCPQG